MSCHGHHRDSRQASLLVGSSGLACHSPRSDRRSTEIRITEPAVDPVRLDISRAEPADAPALTVASIRAFHDDGRRFRGVSIDADLSGPPGYDSPQWQLRMMERGCYYAIRVDARVVGGMVAFPMRGGVCNLGRIWIDPDMQGRGLGRAAIRQLHRWFPEVRTWTLETPAWAVRNHHLYESLGYVKVGERHNPEGFAEFLYRRKRVARNSAPEIDSDVPASR